MSDRKRIEWVTANHRYLQGLRWLPWGLWVLALGAVPLGGLDYGYWLPVPTAVIPWLLWRRLGAYYDRAFGHVDTGLSLPPADKRRWIWILGATVLCIAAGILVERVIIEPVLVFMAASLLSLSVSSRPPGQRFSIRYAALGILLAVSSTFPLFGVAVDALILVGLATVSIGILDHLTLVRTLERLPGDGEDAGEGIAHLDELIHEPARLAILTALSACVSADFLFLQRLAGLTRGDLSAHLSELEDAGLVGIEKGDGGKKPRPQAYLTRKGRHAVERSWKQLDSVGKQAKEQRPEE